MSLKKANRLFKEGNYKEALSLYKQIEPTLAKSIAYNFAVCQKGSKKNITTEDIKLAYKELKNKLSHQVNSNIILPKPNSIVIIKQANQIMLDGYEDAGITFAKKYATNEQIKSIELLEANLKNNTEEKYLIHLNNYLKKFNLSPIKYFNSDKGRFFRLHNDLKYHIVDGPLVTIIMPAYNAEKYIEFSVSSVLNQTWQNIELIIIDDCSSDNTLSIINKLAHKDNRIKILYNQVNVGPYVSKNYGLNHAKGKFITGHDADDFAFSKRIENHMAYMLQNPEVKASTTNKLRVQEDGRFVNFTAIRDEDDDGAAGKAFISCMFERDFLINKLGYWDSVRFGADGEIINRAKILLQDNFKELKLLSMLCLDSAESLTSHAEHGISKTTGLSPARRYYLSNYKSWHLSLKSNNCYLDFPIKNRPFDIKEASSVSIKDITTNMQEG